MINSTNDLFLTCLICRRSWQGLKIMLKWTASTQWWRIISERRNSSGNVMSFWRINYIICEIELLIWNYSTVAHRPIRWLINQSTYFVNRLMRSFMIISFGNSGYLDGLCSVLQFHVTGVIWVILFALWHNCDGCTFQLTHWDRNIFLN